MDINLLQSPNRQTVSDALVLVASEKNIGKIELMHGGGTTDVVIHHFLYTSSIDDDENMEFKALCANAIGSLSEVAVVAHYILKV
jgi:hypothetical protein